jgi:hypothetical protein
MIVLVTIETIALVLLSLLVAALLRSHAEILRRLSPHEASVGGPPMEPDVGAGMRDEAPAPDIAGKTLDGESVKLAVAGGGTSSLVAFLSSGCSTCRQFWDAFQNDAGETLPGGARLIVVTKDTSHESPSKLRELAPADVPVVMSSAAWDAYAVPMTPYFVYVDGATGQIAGEGTAEAWPQVRSLIRDALLDSELVEARSGPSANGDGGAHENGAGANGHKPDSTGRPALTVARSSRIDDELRAAGIGPDHPSLYGPGDPTEP